MENVISTNNIEVDLNETNTGKSIVISLIDKHGHFDDDFTLSNDQAYDLLQGLLIIKDKLKKNEFD